MEESNKPQHINKEDVLSTQVGGNHYSKYRMQPVEAIQKMNLDFVRGNILKYLVRYRDKNGIEDLKKAKHYAESLHQIFQEKFKIGEEFIAQFKDNPEVQRTMRFLFDIGIDLDLIYELRSKLDYLIELEEQRGC